MALTHDLVTPLQYAFSGRLELLIAVIVVLLVVLVPTISIYRDAEKRGMNAALWAVVVGGLLLVGLLPGLAAIAYYLWKREDEVAATTGR